ncbi:MAG: DNA polymerase III subunit chi [Thioalkalispiraceae bacterium]|jgi:DNA polymerase-3 subunit chi
MTRVDFYVLETSVPEERDKLVCRLAEKAYSLDHTIYIHTESPQQAQQLDNLLWTFRDGSFIPHQLHNEQQSETCPVIIGHNHEPESHSEVLINAGNEVPLFFSRFERVAEVVTQDEQQREQARERFKFYRDRGYELETHKLSL